VKNICATLGLSAKRSPFIKNCVPAKLRTHTSYLNQTTPRTLLWVTPYHRPRQIRKPDIERETTDAAQGLFRNHAANEIRGDELVGSDALSEHRAHPPSTRSIYTRHQQRSMVARSRIWVRATQKQRKFT